MESLIQIDAYPGISFHYWNFIIPDNNNPDKVGNSFDLMMIRYEFKKKHRYFPC